MPPLDDVRRVHPPGRDARLRPAPDRARSRRSTSVPAGGPSSYLLILAVEELLDATNRATMKDDRVHPVSRQIAKLHVLEEARHVSFAKTYLARCGRRCREEERAGGRRARAEAVAVVAGLTVDPRGVRGRSGSPAARSWPGPTRTTGPGSSRA